MTTLSSSARASLLLIGGAAAATLSSMAGAADWQLSFQPRLDVGVSYYSLDFGSTSQLFADGNSVSTSSLEFSDTMPTVGAGLTVFADRWFFDVSAQRTFNGSVEDSGSFVDTSPSGRSVGDINYESDDVSRDEYALAVGYGVSESVGVYAGYKWARVSADDLGGSGPSILQLSDGVTVPGYTFTSGNYEFEYDGPFVGTTVGWNIKSGAFDGRLALNAAIAFLSGTLSASSATNEVTFANGQTVSTRSPSEILDSAGDSVGILIGVSWIGQTAVEGLSYSVGVNGYKFDFSADDKGKADINEAMAQFKVGLSYLF